ILVMLYFIRNIRIRFLVMVYVIVALLYISHLSDDLVSLIPFSSPYLETYSSESLIQHYGGGFKLDFLLYNTIFLIIFIVAYHINENLKSHMVYKQILTVYILFSVIFSITGFVAYADRVAGYSWFLIPLLLALIIKNIR